MRRSRQPGEARAAAAGAKREAEAAEQQRTRAQETAKEKPGAPPAAATPPAAAAPQYDGTPKAEGRRRALKAAGSPKTRRSALQSPLTAHMKARAFARKAAPAPGAPGGAAAPAPAETDLLSRRSGGGGPAKMEAPEAAPSGGQQPAEDAAPMAAPPADTFRTMAAPAPEATPETTIAPSAPPARPTPPAAASAPSSTPPAAAAAKKQDQTGWDVVPVFYGTDRAEEPNPKRVSYSSDRGHRLELGRALVTVPKIARGAADRAALGDPHSLLRRDDLRAGRGPQQALHDAGDQEALAKTDFLKSGARAARRLGSASRTRRSCSCTATTRRSTTPSTARRRSPTT